MFLLRIDFLPCEEKTTRNMGKFIHGEAGKTRHTLFPLNRCFVCRRVYTGVSLRNPICDQNSTRGVGNEAFIGFWERAKGNKGQMLAKILRGFADPTTESYAKDVNISLLCSCR